MYFLKPEKVYQKLMTTLFNIFFGVQKQTTALKKTFQYSNSRTAWGKQKDTEAVFYQKF